MVSALMLLVSGSLLTACGGKQKAMIPVDSPLVPWAPPEDLPPAATETAPAETPEAPAADAAKPTATPNGK